MLSMYFVIISPWNGRGPSFEQTETLHTKVCYVPRLVDIGSMVLEMKFLKYCQCIFTFLPLIPLGKGNQPSFENI